MNREKGIQVGNIFQRIKEKWSMKFMNILSDLKFEKKIKIYTIHFNKTDFL